MTKVTLIPSPAERPNIATPTRAPRMAPTEGLYRADKEHDACGVGFIADIHNRPTHAIVEQGLQILVNLTHRGAVGADPEMGDGAGMLTQLPDALFRAEAERLGFTLPSVGNYAVGMVFIPPSREEELKAVVEKVCRAEGNNFLGWRAVPVDSTAIPPSVQASEPKIWQFFIGCGADICDPETFERRLFITRKVISNTVFDGRPPAEVGFVICSLSCRTVVYKGMFLAHQLGAYYEDLRDERYVSALSLVHQRFSTNTFPSWGLAHPYRMVAHNGEINTLRGNVNWMAARQATASSSLYGEEIEKLWPISYEGQSDTACFDNALEFLVQGGYSLTHAMAMLVPEAWAGNPLMGEKRRAFYEYHAALMEPWDGPAAIVFTDGRQIGATLDRNGLRPARYCVTRDGLVVMGSEAGVLPIDEDRIEKKWRLQPGKMLLIDLEEHRIVSDEEIKRSLSTQYPYRAWLNETQIVLEDQPSVRARAPRTNESLLDRQQAFGYSQEDLKLLMSPMAITGQEALGSMGTDTPLSVLSDRSKVLYTYFKQNFAQVTNPPIDPIREELVMSLVSFIGPRPNLFDIEGLQDRKRLEVRQPILTNEDLEKIREIGDIGDNHFHTITLDITYAAERGAEGMETMIERLCERAEKAVLDGFNIIILSDRLISRSRIAIPALLATAGVHHHLIRKGLRTSVGLVVESGEPREVHHFAVLAGYGAEAINPYLAFETLVEIHDTFPEEVDDKEVVTRYIKSIDKGLLKVMSKMGISTYQSYCGAQIFDAVGLSSEFVDKFFFGTATMIEGVGLAEVAEETVRRHTIAFSDDVILAGGLEVGGEYAFRTRGEHHFWQADTVAQLQHAVRLNDADQVRRLLAHGERGIGPLLGPRPLPHQGRRGDGPRARSHRRGRARCGDREALRHRRDEPRRDLQGGARDAGAGDEQDRRQVQHGRGRRGSRPLPRPSGRRVQAFGDQAGRVGPLRRDDGVSRQRRPDPDQDGPGRQARRGRPAARPQGGRGDRAPAPLNAGRRPHLAAAAPRHLLDRRPCAADLRPQERQPGGRDLGEAGVGGRRRHGGGGRREGTRRPHHDRWLRWRHRRIAAHLHQARRLAVGDGACRDAPDAGRQRPALARCRAGRRRAAHRA